MQKIEFPKGFWWGSATSSHQIEGNNYNDWSEWEKSKKRAGELKAQGLSSADFVSGLACDSLNRYQEDFDIAKQLNQNIHRLSIEWSRIEPEEGKFDQKAMQHYIEVVRALKERGIEPMITLWHFTNPVWFANDGGFLNKKSPERFVRFVVEGLRDDASLWITFNEGTTIYSGMAYFRGIWPPQFRSFLKMLRVDKNIIRSHILAYKTIKEIYSQSPTAPSSKEYVPPTEPEVPHASHNIKEPQIGVTENNAWIVAPWYLKILGLGKLVEYYRNFFLLSRAYPYYDFIGLNYYNIARLPGSYSVLPKLDYVEDMGWEIYPEGICKVLAGLKTKYNKPVYVTENGIADAADSRREKFIKDHLYWIWRAMQDGVDVRGYMYWSLLDNFEWHHGYGPRFGLVEIDYAHNQSRKIRSSALEYAKICRDNNFEY